MLYKYSTVTKEGSEQTGTTEASSEEAVIKLLQDKGLIVVSVVPASKKPVWGKDLSLFEHVSSKEVVIMSRQIATLFDAQVSALKAFSMLAGETENPLLARKLEEIASDVQGGASISYALSKHPSIFSNFYVNMVRSGEETGKLSDTFVFLADYLDRNHELSSKVRSALTYPIFVIGVFIVVMVLLLTMVVPKLKDIIEDSGQEVPGYTKIVLNASDFLTNYGLLSVFALVVIAVTLWYLIKTGTLSISKFKLNIHLAGNLYKKLYLSRIADNLSTMLSSGVSVVKALEITSNVVDDVIYKKVLHNASEDVKKGFAISATFAKNPDEIPKIMVLMMKVGEETGELSSIMKTISKFYRREVESAIENLISLIEPAMIVSLGVGIGFVLASVMMPIYDIAGV